METQRNYTLPSLPIEFECPHIQRKLAGDETYDICELSTKPCLIEHGLYECETWNEIKAGDQQVLKEHEWDDNYYKGQRAGQKEEYRKWIKACMKAGMLISEPEQLVDLYKAGQDSVFDSMPDNLPPLLEMAHRSGIMEVVEWIESEAAIDRMMRERWRLQVKEWGIIEELQEVLE